MRFAQTSATVFFVLMFGALAHADLNPSDPSRLSCGTNQKIASKFRPGLSVEDVIQLRVADCAALGDQSKHGDLVLLERTFQDLRDYGDDSYRKLKREFWLDPKNRLVWDNLPIPDDSIVTSRANDLQELRFQAATEKQALLLLSYGKIFDLMSTRSGYRCLLSAEPATTTTCTYMKAKAYYDEFGVPVPYPRTVACDVQPHTIIDVNQNSSKTRFNSCSSKDPNFDSSAILLSDASKCNVGNSQPQMRLIDLCSTYFVSTY
jgi:hypothetical protein